jgi:hypothetical protein
MLNATYLDHLGSNEANATLPALGWIVQDVVDPEARVFLDQRVQVLSEQDVFRVDIGKDQVDLGLVSFGTSTNDGADYLQHRGDASASCDHAKAAHHVRRVYHGAPGTLDFHGLIHLKAGNMLGDVSGGIRLDQEIKVAGRIV